MKSDLLSVLVQVIENVKENILGARFSRKELHIVNNQYIDHLIEVNEIVLVVVSYRIDCDMRSRAFMGGNDYMLQFSALLLFIRGHHSIDQGVANKRSRSRLRSTRACRSERCGWPAS